MAGDGGGGVLICNVILSTFDINVRKNIDCNHVTGLVWTGGREEGGGRRVRLLIMGG